MSALSDVPRHKLSEIVSTYGPSVYEDGRLCRALLRDGCPGNEREVALLVDAVEQKVPHELQASKGAGERDGILFGLVRHLVAQLGVTEADAIWAVESWSAA